MKVKSCAIANPVTEEPFQLIIRPMIRVNYLGVGRFECFSLMLEAPSALKMDCLSEIPSSLLFPKAIHRTRDTFDAF